MPLAAAEPEVLPPGFVFGNYVIQANIGRGAMASVYRAEHSLLRKPVALKVMDRELLSNADARQRFLREGQAAAAIKHPNVVDITDVGLFDGTPYLVMELLEGEDLECYLARHGRLPEAEVIELALPLVAALAAAHDSGVVHRDLKPGNIFLSRTAEGELLPKILDFGVSKFSRYIMEGNPSSTPFDQLMGSPLYLPPEALQGARELTARSDQYSLGVVLYECITGEPPFLRDALLPLLNAISAGQFESPRSVRPEISPLLEHAIMRTMSADPEQRFEHVRDLGRILLAGAGMRARLVWGRTFGQVDALALVGETAPPVSVQDRSSEPAVNPFKQQQRRRIGIALAAVALLCSGWFALHSLQREPAAEDTPRSAAQGALQPLVVQQPVAPPTATLDPRAVATPELERPQELATAPARARNMSRATTPVLAKAKPRAQTAMAMRPARRDAADLMAQPAFNEPTSPSGAASVEDDDVRDMFFPASRRPTDSARAAPAEGAGVANEAPILD